MMKKIYLFLFALLFLISFTIAQQPAPPPQTNVNINLGLTIDFPKIASVQINTDQTFNFHVFNVSNGMKVDNISTICMFHLFNFTGDHIISEQEVTFETTGNDWEITVQGANFSHNRLYSILVDCNDGGFGGFASFSFDVTPTGSIIEKPEASFYFIIVFSVLLLFALFLTIGIVTPFGNKKEETREGTAITGISFKKYLKVMSLWIAYGFFLWFIVIIAGIANNYIFFEGLRGMIFSLSLYLNTLGYGVNIFMVFLLLWMTWKDIVLNKKIINQGKVLLSELSR